ncbi:MAG: ROK family protein [Streptosporangiaceae bacterium]
MRVVAALGGNAPLERGEKPDSDIQEAHILRAACALAPLARAHDLVITHGNGPQVGLLALESARDPALSRPYTLDVLGAQTQGMIGYWLVRALKNAVPERAGTFQQDGTGARLPPRRTQPRSWSGYRGRVDYEHGRLERAENLPAGWVKALGENDFSAAVGIPVAVANDADLAAVGEAWLGAGRPWSDVVYLTVSTGIGAGVVLGDQLVHGRRSLAEVGNCLVGPAGLRIGSDATTIEDVASGPALMRRAERAGLVADGPDIIAAWSRAFRPEAAGRS